ncbi:MAG: biotin/lipoyl-binding protein [Bacteroidia bacterium]|nr:biotin/lipoyl-binding protein [Bacteroidia bacterium]MCF8427131.1 biotin/lipoyl-binding protein [Bacteroidia bacterium]MCF8447003.1 biotin/lipoyl-binding protein [Bacteroidia bacterium]
MLNIQVNEQEFIYDLLSGVAVLDGQAVNADAVKLAPNKYHVLINHKSYNIELLSKTENGKGMVIGVNGVKQEIAIKDKYDALLHQLGMDKLMGSKNNNLKAPMPGLVLRVLVQEGDTVKKGDGLLVLEAMKMENVIKADGEAKVKKVLVEPKQVVEKNMLLIEME